MVIRPATEADIPAVLPVFEAAKAIMRADGNHEQWGAPGFPGDALLLRDIARGGGYVISSEAEGGVEKSHIRIRGLMGMATNTEDDAVIDADFERIEGLFRRIREEFPELRETFTELSIGMSQDWPIAVRHGATMVRIGTDIFGPREY